MNDRTAALIARNQELLAIAAEARATARRAIERAEKAVQAVMETAVRVRAYPQPPAPFHQPSVIQVQTGPPEQRIGVAPQRPDQRPDPPSVDQPHPIARLPHAAGLAHQGR